MTEPKKRGRKSNAEKAAILAAQEQAGAGEQQAITQDPVHIAQADSVSMAQPAKPKLSDHETNGLIQEALWSHERQEPSIRFDSRHRRWSFMPEARNNRASLVIAIKRGSDEREMTISNARFGAEAVEEEVKAIIDLLDEALS